MKKIEVKTHNKSYSVIIGKDVFSIIRKDLLKSNSKTLFICDSNVYKLYKNYLDDLIQSDNKFHCYNFYPTEKNKNLKSVELIYNYLTENSFSRRDIIISIGGGITGDVAGFVAATFMRGIPFYQVPTTLLSMVDSSVGGKTGVNLGKFKNFIGSFYQPQKVYSDLNFLLTLPFREIISGAGEIFKYAFLGDEDNYSKIRDSLYKIILNKEYDEKLIERCVKLKASVVQDDEFEISGVRKVLNLGHTFAHAFESALNFQVKHGEAVIAGIFASLIISEKLGLITKPELQGYFSDFKFLPVNKKILQVDTQNLIKFMKSDKKASDGKIKLVLVSEPGSILIDILVNEKLVKKSLEELFKVFRTV